MTIYERAKPLLDAWVEGGIKGTREIREECESMINPAAEEQEA